MSHKIDMSVCLTHSITGLMSDISQHPSIHIQAGNVHKIIGDDFIITVEHRVEDLPADSTGVVVWSNAARTEYQKLLGEIKGLTAQIANLDI